MNGFTVKLHITKMFILVVCMVYTELNLTGWSVSNPAILTSHKHVHTCTFKSTHTHTLPHILASLQGFHMPLSWHELGKWNPYWHWHFGGKRRYADEI